MVEWADSLQGGVVPWAAGDRWIFGSIERCRAWNVSDKKLQQGAEEWGCLRFPLYLLWAAVTDAVSTLAW
jgi:hypothetical protein